MFDAKRDARIRVAVFAWLEEQVALHGDVLARELLAKGFQLDGLRVPLVGPQGIFKPQVSQLPISITTSPDGPYNDSFDTNGLLRYRYRGTDPGHRDNQGLRFAMERRLPLVYFHGVVPGKYLVARPVFVVADDPRNLVFTVAVDSRDDLAAARELGTGTVEDSDIARRKYLTAVVRVRLHQRAFRERVLDAYRRQCAFCRLRHDELLDAAHIVPDTDPGGEPSVQNGLSLCTLHHAAFDRYFIGVRPDFTIHVRDDLRRERDGPTLLHAIQGLHDSRILLPRRASHQPTTDRLEARYERFLQASGTSRADA